VVLSQLVIVSDVLFFVMMLSWIVCRLYLYLVMPVFSATWEAYDLVTSQGYTGDGSYWFFIALLWGLYVMQLYWFYLICLVAKKALRGNASDIREDDSEEENETPKKKKNQVKQKKTN